MSKRIVIMNSRIMTIHFFLIGICFAGVNIVFVMSHQAIKMNKKSTAEMEPTQKVVTTNEIKGNLFCNRKENGLYIGGCTWFYRCNDNKTEHVPCPVDLVVNDRYMYCDYPEKVDPPCGKAPNCTDIWDGNYPDYTRQCKFYYTCLRGRFHGYTKCPAALFFDVDKDSCDWPTLIPPPCGTKVNP